MYVACGACLRQARICREDPCPDAKDRNCKCAEPVEDMRSDKFKWTGYIVWCAKCGMYLREGNFTS
jgi:hypothetical protein